MSSIENGTSKHLELSIMDQFDAAEADGTMSVDIFWEKPTVRFVFVND